VRNPMPPLIRKQQKIVAAVGVLLALSFLVPFVMVRTFFPFYRYGMFAEPPTTEAQKEEFVILYEDENGLHEFYAPNVGINAANFTYLKRNYFYRKQSEVLLDRVKAMADGQNLTTHWRLLRLLNGDTTHQVWLDPPLNALPSESR